MLFTKPSIINNGKTGKSIVNIFIASILPASKFLKLPNQNPKYNIAKGNQATNTIKFKINNIKLCIFWQFLRVDSLLYFGTSSNQ